MRASECVFGSDDFASVVFDYVGVALSRLQRESPVGFPFAYCYNRFIDFFGPEEVFERPEAGAEGVGLGE